MGRSFRRGAKPVCRGGRVHRGAVAVPARHSLQVGDGEPALELPRRSKHLRPQVLYQIPSSEPRVPAYPPPCDQGGQVLWRSGGNMAPLLGRRRWASTRRLDPAAPSNLIRGPFGTMPFFPAHTVLIHAAGCGGQRRSPYPSGISHS